VEQLLEREEALATQSISEAVLHLGDELCSATDLRARIRRHPLLATALGAGLGFVGGPPLLRALRPFLRAATALTSLRGLRGLE
jgi:hypothetical protein